MQEPLQLVPTIGGTMLPQLDWWQYNQLAGDLEEVNNRISALTKQLKFRGVRDQTIKELEKLASAPDNTFIAIKDYQQFVQKGGLSKAFEVLPIKELSDVLVQTIAAADQIEAKIDRLTGIADIMRGDSDANETATAQQIKAQYGGIRIKMRQRAVQAWIRDGLRIDAELLAEQFDASILAAMSGLEVSDELMAMLKDDKLRSFRIDIESDSTVFEDGESQKQANAEIINTIVPLMEKGVMAAAQAPELTEVIFEVMALALRSMKGGRAMEDVLDRAKQSMQQRMQMQAQQAANPQPDPAIAQEKENRALDREERMMDHDMKQSDASRQEQAAEVEHRRELERMGAKAEFDAMKPRKGGSLQ
jgi:hypothetical protein